MKHLYVFALALLCFSTGLAQTTYQPGENGNNCTLHIEFDDVDDLSESSFTLSMTNPSTPICALSAYFIIDDNSVRPWSYDPISNSYEVEMNEYSKKNKEGRVTTQSLQTQLSDDSNPEHPGYFYVSIAGADNFLGEEGEMAYIYFDATKLKNGNHVLYMKDAFCGSIIGDDINNMKSYKYLCNDQEIHFNVNNGTLTVLSNINVFPQNSETPETFDLQGRHINTLFSKGLYISGGRKILR